MTGAATRAPRIISAETLARNPRMAVDASGKLVKTKLIEQGAKRQLVAKGLRVVGMTVTLVLTPQDMGNNGYLATGYKSPKNSTADEPVLPLRTITNDPSKISDEELARVAERINNGTADVNDYNLQDEINRRRKEAKDALKQRVTGGKVTFTKLTTLEIETMKELFGGGDEKFIEKVKTGSGTNAGQVDLYKEDSTGDIYIKPKGKPELSGENTGYNVSQLKSTDK